MLRRDAVADAVVQSQLDNSGPIHSELLKILFITGALPGSPQTGGVVEHSTGKGLSLSPHHVPQLVQGQLAISRVLPDVQLAGL